MFHVHLPFLRPLSPLRLLRLHPWAPQMKRRHSFLFLCFFSRAILRLLSRHWRVCWKTAPSLHQVGSGAMVNIETYPAAVDMGDTSRRMQLWRDSREHRTIRINVDICLAPWYRHSRSVKLSGRRSARGWKRVGPWWYALSRVLSPRQATVMLQNKGR